MSQPSIYVSCVSAEFRSTRRRVAALLTKMGYRPVMQEITGNEPGDMRLTLRNRIFNCQGLIHIAGHAYGPESQTPDREFGRVSHAQFEYLYARKANLPTWLIIAGDQCIRDTPINQLNTSADAAGLQRQFLQARNSADQIHRQASSDADIDQTIQQLQNDLSRMAKLKVANVERPKVKAPERESSFVRNLLGLILLATLIAVPVYISRILRDPAPPRPDLTAQERTDIRDKIRDNLQIVSKKLFDGVIYDSERAHSEIEKDRLKGLAESEMALRQARMESLTAVFQEYTKTDRASSVFDQMSFSLRDKGVDQAVDYIMSQKNGILESVKARGDIAKEQNRLEMLPLLKTCDLLSIVTRDNKAIELIQEIEAVDPTWIDAMTTQFWVELHFGNRIQFRETSDQAAPHYLAAQKTAQRLNELQPNNSQWKHFLLLTNEKLKAGGTGRLPAIASTNPSTSPTSNPNDPAAIAENSADALLASGDSAGALENFSQAVTFRKTRVAEDLNNIGEQKRLLIVLMKLGTLQQAQSKYPDATSSFTQANTLLLRLSTLDPESRSLQESILDVSNRMAAIKMELKDFPAAVPFYIKALEIYRNFATVESGRFQNVENLWVATIRVAECLEKANHTSEARTYWKKAFEVLSDARIRFPAQVHNTDATYTELKQKAGY